MANIWTRLQKLSYSKDVRVGEVTEILAGGLSKLVDAYGQTFIATGQSVTIGNKAYVEDGTISGEAPDLDEYEEFV